MALSGSVSRHVAMIGARKLDRVYGDWHRYTPSQYPLGARPFLSDLSRQEFWTLLQAGYYPAGVVFGYCSYHALGSRLTQQINGWWNGGSYNQEIVPFSQGIYTARHLAMTRVNTMAQQQKALGIVGMHIDNQRQIMEYDTEQPPLNTLISLYIFRGWHCYYIVKKDHVIPTPKPTLTLTDLRPGRYGQKRELTFRG